jgi:hypothetical protein
MTMQLPRLPKEWGRLDYDVDKRSRTAMSLIVKLASYGADLPTENG